MNTFILFMIILALIQAIVLGVIIFNLITTLKKNKMVELLWLIIMLSFLLIHGLSSPIIKEMIGNPILYPLIPIFQLCFVISYLIFINKLFEEKNQIIYKIIVIISMCLSVSSLLLITFLK